MDCIAIVWDKWRHLMIENILKKAAVATPDPERVIKNLTSFLEENPDS